MAYRNNNYNVEFNHPFNTIHKTTAQGAATGMQMSGGNHWGALIGAIIGTVTGVVLSREQTKDTYKQFQSMLKAADSQNKATLQELSRNLSEVYRQRAVQAMETQSALAYNKAKATSAYAEAQNVLAAADQIGSAVDYMRSQVALEASQQDWMAKYNYETVMWNTNVQAQNLINTADAQFVGVNVKGPKFNKAEAINDAISALGQAASSMGGKGGKSGGSTTPSTPSGTYVSKYTGTNTQGWFGSNKWSVGSSGMISSRGGSYPPSYSSVLGL